MQTINQRSHIFTVGGHVDVSNQPSHHTYIINLAKCIDHHIYLAQQRIHSFDCIAALAKRAKV